jgi:S-adenosylmethionine:tRNA ribosyltransferase-isomerase
MYKTIYAKKVLQQPTAGLHFSKHLLKSAKSKELNLPEVTHVGLGTFNQVEDLSKHKMDLEELKTL